MAAGTSDRLNAIVGGALVEFIAFLTTQPVIAVGSSETVYAAQQRLEEWTKAIGFPMDAPDVEHWNSYLSRPEHVLVYEPTQEEEAPHGAV